MPLCNRIGELINDKVIEGIAHVNNESNNKEGTRIVVDLKERCGRPGCHQPALQAFTELQTSYGINNVALVKGRPKILNLKDLISEFIEFRHEVVVRRTQYELRKAQKKEHISWKVILLHWITWMQ